MRKQNNHNGEKVPQNEGEAIRGGVHFSVPVGRCDFQSGQVPFCLIGHKAFDCRARHDESRFQRGAFLIGRRVMAFGRVPQSKGPRASHYSSNKRNEDAEPHVGLVLSNRAHPNSEKNKSNKSAYRDNHASPPSNALRLFDWNTSVKRQAKAHETRRCGPNGGLVGSANTDLQNK